MRAIARRHGVLAAAPTPFPGAALWLHGDEGKTVSAGRVASWSSKTGVLTPSQATSGLRPADALHGVTGDGLDDSLAFGTNNLIDGATGATLFLVLTPGAIGANFSRLLIIGTNGGVGSTRLSFNLGPGGAGGFPQIQFRITDNIGPFTVTAPAPLPVNQMVLISAVVDLVANSARIYIDGVLVTNVAAGGTGTFGVLPSAGGAVVGQGSNVLNGDYNDLMVYSSAMSDAARQQTEAYFRWLRRTP